MKRLRSSGERLLDIKSIIECGLGRYFVFSHLKEGRLNGSHKFLFSIYPDAKMGKDEGAYLSGPHVVFVSSKQYELLVMTPPKVLGARFQEMERLSFKTNDGNRVFYHCFHSDLIVNAGHAYWEITFTD